MKTMILIGFLAIITTSCYPRGVLVCNQGGCGNGVVLESGNKVLTVEHNMISGKSDTKIVVPGDYYLGSYKIPIVEVKKIKGRDAAVLKTGEIYSRKYRICENDPKIGENVTIQYYKSPTVRYRIKSIINHAYKNAFYVLFMGDPGISGAPVISDKHCLYGLAARNTNAGLKIERLIQKNH